MAGFQPIISGRFWGDRRGRLNPKRDTAEDRSWKQKNIERETKDFERRLRRVIDMLDSVPFVLLRSSSSGGCHLYLFFDQEYDRDEVRAALVARIEAEVGRVESGKFEVWPANTALRLPLGRGSCLLDPVTRQPVHAWFDRGARLHLDRPSAVAEFIQRAEASRVSLDTIMTRKKRLMLVREEDAPYGSYGEDSDEKCPPAGRVSRRGTSSKAREPYSRTDYSTTAHTTKKTTQKQTITVATKKTSAINSSEKNHHFREEVAASEHGITAYGRRHLEGPQRVFFLFIVQKLSKDKTLVEYERWLREGNHVSKDLENNREPTIQRMLHEARKYTDQLTARLSSGDLTRPLRRGRAFSTIMKTMMERGSAWRDEARAALTEHDHRLLSNLNDEVVRRCVEIFVGLLRIGDREKKISLLSVSSTCLDRLCGKRSRESSFNRFKGEVIYRSLYTLVIREAERLKLLAFKSSSKRKENSRVYRVWLPSDDTSCVLCGGRRPKTKQARYCSAACMKSASRQRVKERMKTPTV